MTLQEKALELAGYLADRNIIEWENEEALDGQSFHDIISQIHRKLQEKYPQIKIRRIMKSVHYANGFPDEALKQSAFLLDDIEQYLCRNHLMDHDASVRYFNQLITTGGRKVTPENLVLTMMDSILITA